ncbi:cell wall hydrolase [uncultured Tateyamaria sp.]|uniref:cell wall hydrolase n=1 Tax=uncultured Tateyamaria sp. TaxID=455651 RepID=UPI0026273D36|nr:cell wall hydrolase [uncultured Tateyamaria sp.]
MITTRPRIYRDANDDEHLINLIFEKSLVVVEEGAVAVNGRVPVTSYKLIGADPVEGWIEESFLIQSVDDAAIAGLLNGFDEAHFVPECCTYQLRASTGATPPSFGVSADYMIALAIILTELKPENFNKVPGLTGPYQVSPVEWAAFAAAHPEAPLGPFRRFLSFPQLRYAVWKSTLDYDAITAMLTADDLTEVDQVFVPSFLNLLHAWLLGVDAAIHVDAIHREGDPNVALEEALKASNTALPKEKQIDVDAAMQAVGRVIKHGDLLTIDSFVEQTANALNKALKSAFSKIKKHASSYLAKVPSTDAPWMTVAEQQKTRWGGQSETTDDGRAMVREYFASIGIDNDGTSAWCGAFAGHCLVQSGNEKLAESLTNLPARAADWVNWGDTEFLSSDPKIPEGAVVVLHPTAGSTASGHVTFFKRRIPGSKKIECLGGNQSDTCKVSTYPVSRIRAVRWMNVDPTPHQNALSDYASGDAVLVVALTLWGEARGEPSRKGREAVANVIANRVADDRQRFGSGHKGVCLKPWQFSCWNAGDNNLQKMRAVQDNPDAEFEECMDIADQMFLGSLPDHTGGAQYYHANYVMPKWARHPNAEVSAVIGNHIFYTGVP